MLATSKAGGKRKGGREGGRVREGGSERKANGVMASKLQKPVCLVERRRITDLTMIALQKGNIQ